MKSAILLHGKPSKEEYYNPDIPSASNHHWFPWLQKQLLVHDIVAHTPEVPNAWHHDYPTWQKEFERYEITPETMLVGHSTGGGFILRWLGEHNNIRVKKVILVAPWLDPERESTTNFFQFNLDPELASRTESLVIFNSNNDMESVQESVRIIRSKLDNINYREFHNYGHFCLKDLKSEKFPELLEELLK